MFKAGDMVKCIRHYDNTHYPKGYEFVVTSVEEINNLWIVGGVSKGGIPSKVYAKDVILVNAPIFKVGDIVTLTKDHATLQSMGMKTGVQFQLVNGYDYKLPHPVVAYIHTKCWVALIDNNGELTQFASFFEHTKEEKQNDKTCTCDSLILFRKGCQCGAVQKRQWGLRA